MTDSRHKQQNDQICCLCSEDLHAVLKTLMYHTNCFIVICLSLLKQVKVAPHLLSLFLAANYLVENHRSLI